MDAVKNDVKRLVKIELAAANKKFRMFAGPHEGAGIIQEEVVEAVQEMNGLRQELNVPSSIASRKMCLQGFLRFTKSLQVQLARLVWYGSLPDP